MRFLGWWPSTGRANFTTSLYRRWGKLARRIFAFTALLRAVFKEAKLFQIFHFFFWPILAWRYVKTSCMNYVFFKILPLIHFSNETWKIWKRFGFVLHSPEKRWLAPPDGRSTYSSVFIWSALFCSTTNTSNSGVPANQPVFSIIPMNIQSTAHVKVLQCAPKTCALPWRWAFWEFRSVEHIALYPHYLKALKCKIVVVQERNRTWKMAPDLMWRIEMY